MNNNLKLQIITALDNAGITAAKQQINSLTKDIQNANSQMGGLGGNSKNVDKVFRKLGGNVADFAGAFGKLGGSIGIVYAGFQAFLGSFKIADKFFQSFTREGTISLDSIKDGFKNLGHSIKEFFTGWDSAQARRNEKLKDIQDGITNGLKSAIQQSNDELNETLSTQQKISQEINNSTKSYLAQANALKGLNNAKGDEELIGLEQDKFDNAQWYRNQGDEEGAQQIEKYYDWLITQRKAAIEIDNAENELAKHIQTANASEKLVKAKKKEIFTIDNTIENQEADYNNLVDLYTKQGTLDTEEHKKRLHEFDTNIENLVKQRNTKQTELSQLEEQSKADQIKQTELAYRLTNISKRGIYQTDVAGANYQSWVSQNGNVLGLEFDEQYGKQAYGQLEVKDDLKAIVEQLKTNNETLKELLGIKQ